ncbi:MAG: hypothetical protein HOP33_08930 [Verrucomicrobia bacterium]|nr:hypothetical protein [Verrucomicrobiota bacterium]
MKKIIVLIIFACQIASADSLTNLSITNFFAASSTLTASGIAATNYLDTTRNTQVALQFEGYGSGGSSNTTITFTFIQSGDKTNWWTAPFALVWVAQGTNLSVAGTNVDVGAFGYLRPYQVISTVTNSVTNSAAFPLSAILKSDRRDNAVTLNLNPVFGGQFKTIASAGGSLTEASVAGTYFLPLGDAVGITGTGTLYPPCLIHIVGADYPTINGVAAKLRIRAILEVNDVAPTGNFTFGLYPVTRPSTSGGAGLDIYAMGTVVTGSNGATFTVPAADSQGTAVSADFALPADGVYVIGIVTTATVAASSHLHVSAMLQYHNN